MTAAQAEVEGLADMAQTGDFSSYAALITAHLVVARKMILDVLGDDPPRSSSRLCSPSSSGSPSA